MGKHVRLLQSVPANFGMEHHICVSVIVRLSTVFSGESWPTKRSSKSSGPVWHHSEKLRGAGNLPRFASWISHPPKSRTQTRKLHETHETS